ncbi:MAG TPA: N-acetyltransferase [Candidatus Omnitrophota bacterium]|nr:N-acetyltransferase [Candidatus Omnitrophota bacterium]HQJ16194.1 N-acetyltransferase [Candidatus Omnitrophota bacterium]
MLRKARVQDIKQIQALINSFARKDLMLARSLNELYEGIRDFWVYEKNGRILGCCALHISWDDLAEIKSLAVRKDRQSGGIGSKLVSACLAEAKDLGSKRVFVLTYQPSFFTQFGFKRVRHDALPHKVWAECINCPKFPNCQEISLLKVL